MKRWTLLCIRSSHRRDIELDQEQGAEQVARLGSGRLDVVDRDGATDDNLTGTDLTRDTPG